jgi:hypothetical protein
MTAETPTPKRAGRPTRAGSPAVKRLCIRLTLEEWDLLVEAAQGRGSATAYGRDAIIAAADEDVDFDRRRQADRRKVQVDVAVERRSGQDRRHA